MTQAVLPLNQDQTGSVCATSCGMMMGMHSIWNPWRTFNARSATGMALSTAHDAQCDPEKAERNGPEQSTLPLRLQRQMNTLWYEIESTRLPVSRVCGGFS